MWMHYLAIGLGGALGAIIRVGLSRLLIPTLWGIPIPILAINILGCFAMGLLTECLALYWSPHENLRAFMVSGFLGGFTTFSAFALEWGLLQEKGASGHALLYAILSFSLSILGFWGGMRLIRTCF